MDRRILTSTKELNIIYCVIQFLYWTGGCIAIGFAAAVLGELGYTNSAIGVISAVSSVIGFALMLATSVYIDRKSGKAILAIMALAVSAQILCLIPILRAKEPGMVVSVCYIIYLSLAHVLNNAVTKLYIDLKYAGADIDFGIARGIGSLAFACTSAIAGSVMEQYSHSLILISGQAAFLGSMIFCLSIKNKAGNNNQTVLSRKDREKPSSRGSFAGKYGLFILLTAGISLVSASNKTLTVFLVNIVKNVGGSMRSFGIISGYLAFIEIPITLMYSLIRKKFSVPFLLAASLCFYTLKIAGYMLAGNTAMLIAASSLQVFSTGIFQPSTVEYVRENIDHDQTGVAQSMINGMPLIFSCVFTAIFGVLLDGFSVSFLLPLVFAAATAGTAISFACLIIGNRKQKDA